MQQKVSIIISFVVFSFYLTVFIINKFWNRLHMLPYFRAFVVSFGFNVFYWFFFLPRRLLSFPTFNASLWQQTFTLQKFLIMFSAVFFFFCVKMQLQILLISQFYVLYFFFFFGFKLIWKALVVWDIFFSLHFYPLKHI